MTDEQLYKNPDARWQRLNDNFSALVARFNVVFAILLLVVIALVLMVSVPMFMGAGSHQIGSLIITLASMASLIMITGMFACLYVCKQHLHYLEWGMGELLHMTDRMVRQGEQKQNKS